MILFIAAAVIQAGIFQVYYLVTKSLQEKGLSNWGVLHYQRLAVIPGGILLAATFRREYISFFIANPVVLGAIVFSSAVWIIHTYLRLSVIEKVNSMAFFSAFSAVISLPLLLLAGIVMNHDFPNGIAIIALTLLTISLAVRPTVHEHNKQKTTLTIGILAAILITAAGQIIDALNMGAYRYFFANFAPILFGINLFIFLSALTINIVFWIRSWGGKPYSEGSSHRLGYLLPVLFTVATLFEGYSVTRMPIYTLAAIGSFTFLISAIGDLYSRRIIFNLRTAIFVSLVALGTGLSAVSLL